MISKLSQQELFERTGFSCHSSDTCYLENNAFGLCSIQGNKKEQEDAFDVNDDLDDFISLTQEQKELTIRLTIGRMQEKYGMEFVGTTLCMAMAWHNPETEELVSCCANLGDSVAYLIVLDDSGNFGSSQSKRLNALHNPDPTKNIDEYNRVELKTNSPPYKDEGGYYRLGMPGQGLMVSRSIGDEDFELYGLSHEPELFFTSEKFPANYSSYIVVATDGLEDIDINSIGAVVSQNHREKKIVSETALDLVTCEIQENDKKSSINASECKEIPPLDNISVAVFKVDENVRSAVMLDGHRGAQVANNIKKDFYLTLKTFSKSVAIDAIQNYLDWQAYKNKNHSPEEDKKWTRIEANRGPETCFTRWRHMRSFFLKSTAQELLDELRKNTVSDEMAKKCINKLLCKDKTRYHKHSLSSFLLDDLSKITGSEWENFHADKKTHKYNKKLITEALRPKNPKL